MSKCIVFGDSIMKGLIYNEETKRLEPLQESCMNRLSQDGIPIINHSLFGATITKGIATFKRFSQEIAPGDLVLIEFGGNDCNFNWKAISDEPHLLHEPKTTITRFSEEYATLIRSVKDRGATPILLNLPPLDAPSFFKQIIKGSSASKIKNWLGDVHHIYRWQERYSLEVEALSRKWNCPMVDIRSALLDREPLQKLLCKDGMHPNKEGHKFIYEAIKKKLQTFF